MDPYGKLRRINSGLLDFDPDTTAIEEEDLRDFTHFGAKKT